MKALDWFLQDCEDQGLTLSQYERKYGIILPPGKFPNPAHARIIRNEVSAGLMGDDDYRVAKHVEKRRAETRRAVRDLLPPEDCD